MCIDYPNGCLQEQGLQENFLALYRPGGCCCHPYLRIAGVRKAFSRIPSSGFILNVSLDDRERRLGPSLHSITSTASGRSTASAAALNYSRYLMHPIFPRLA